MDDNPTLEAHMDKCCNICGDVGVIDGIVTCAQCKTSHEHLYCMGTYRMEKPKSWYCEECEDLIKASSLNNPGKLQFDSARFNVLPNDLRQNPMDHKKKIQTGKVKPLSREEVIMLTSGAVNSGSPVKASFHPSVVHRKRRSMLEKTPTKTGGKGIMQDPLLKHSQKEYIQKGQSRTSIKDNADIGRAQNTVGKPATASTRTSPVRDNRPIVISEKDATRAPLKKHRHSQKGHVHKGQPTNTIINNADARRAQFAVENTGLAVSCNMIADPRSGSAPPKVAKCLYIPASDASWTGSFNILLSSPNQGEISGGIKAHPPSKARKKVFESSKLMPEVLKFELVQRGSLWMSLFENYCPDRRDIGLYFFPSTSERCKNYMSLLEHIGEEDLVLRKYMDGVELFIFTSKLLHLDCQRWNGMYFLWGVFRRIKLTINGINQCHDEGSNNQVAEMEIDMIGGENIGRLDVAVPRIPLLLPPETTAEETFADIPPGFEKTYRPKVQASHSSGKGGFGACLKVEKPGEENQGYPGMSMRKDDSLQASPKPMVSPGLDFQHPLKNVKSELQ